MKRLIAGIAFLLFAAACGETAASGSPAATPSLPASVDYRIYDATINIAFYVETEDPLVAQALSSAFAGNQEWTFTRVSRIPAGSAVICENPKGTATVLDDGAPNQFAAQFCKEMGWTVAS